MYTSLQSHKPDFNIVVSNLMSLLVLYTALDWSFILTQIFVLNLDSWFDALSKKFIIFDIP